MRLLMALLFLFLFNLSTAKANECDIQIKASEGTKKLNSILACLKNEIQTLKSMKVGVSNFPKVVDQSLFSTERKAIILDTISHSFPICKRQKSNVECKLILKNSSNVRTGYAVYLDHSKSTAFSDHMSQDTFKEGKFANWTKSYDSTFEIVFPEGVTLPLSFKIIGTPAEAKFFQIINLHVFISGKKSKSYNLSYKNVPIE